MSYPPLIESFNLTNLKCKEHNQPVNYVCLIPSCTTHLFCQTCMTQSHSHHKANMIQYKDYLKDQYQLESDFGKMFEANKGFVPIIQKEDSVLNLTKREQEPLIEELFNDLTKMSKILIESTRDKFLYFFKTYYDSVMQIVDDTKQMEEKNTPKIKDLLTKTNTGDMEACNNMFEGLLENSYKPKKDGSQEESLDKLLKAIPQINVERFNEAKKDILQYTKERLTKLLDFHVLILSKLFLKRELK